MAQRDDFDLFPSSSCQVYPIQGFPDQEICDVSTKLINEHLGRFTSTSRILQQVRTQHTHKLLHSLNKHCVKELFDLELNSDAGSFLSVCRQRQTIEMVPLTHAYYTYSGKEYNFFVYGMENKVFAAKYPSACSIL